MQFLLKLTAKLARPEVLIGDAYIWKLDSKREYIVKSAY